MQPVSRGRTVALPASPRGTRRSGRLSAPAFGCPLDRLREAGMIKERGGSGPAPPRSCPPPGNSPAWNRPRSGPRHAGRDLPQHTPRPGRPGGRRMGHPLRPTGPPARPPQPPRHPSRAGRSGCLPAPADPAAPPSWLPGRGSATDHGAELPRRCPRRPASPHREGRPARRSRPGHLALRPGRTPGHPRQHPLEWLSGPRHRDLRRGRPRQPDRGHRHHQSHPGHSSTTGQSEKFQNMPTSVSETTTRPQSSE